MFLIWSLRSAISGILFVIWTLSLSLSAIVAGLVSDSPKVKRWHLKWWGRVACHLFGVKVHVEGFDHWPFATGAVVLFNHTSFFDIFAMSGYLPDMRFGAKQELFKIPLFGPAMHSLGILPIDRARKEKVFKIYEKSAGRLKGGEKIALAPEGGRTQTPESIGPFKSGPFVFALQAEVPLVPVVISGAYQIMPKGSWLPNARVKKSNLYLEILPVISLSEQDLEGRAALQTRVRASMQDSLNRHFTSVQ